MNEQALKLPFYNAAVDLIERNVVARPDKIAYIDERGSYTFADLAERTNRCANALTNLGLALETRILVCLLDTIDFPAVFLGAIKAGVVPVAVNTLLGHEDRVAMTNRPGHTPTAESNEQLYLFLEYVLKPRRAAGGR